VYVQINLGSQIKCEDLGVDERIIVEWIFGKHGGRLCIGFIWLWIGTTGRLCKHFNEASGSMNCE
jgi:hypothetical protein